MKRWLAALTALLAGAVGWFLLSRRREGLAMTGDPWATPAVAHRPPAAAPLGAPASARAMAADDIDVSEPVDAPTRTGEPDRTGEVEEGPFGPGSARPLPDGSAPEGFTIKGKSGSMLYHTSDSPYYARTKADAWFRDEASAEAAGFKHWDRKRRS